MLGSTILEVAIGMIFVYLLVSLMLTAMTELISTYLRLRANTLWDGIRNMVDSPQAEEWVKELYSHPLIKGLMPPHAHRKPGRIARFLRPRAKGPSYIPSRTFALVLLDVVRSRGELPEGDPLGRSLDVLAEDAGWHPEKLKENVEVWFNNSMERVGGWYKRKIQAIHIVLGLGLAFFLNVDSLLLMRTLQTNSALRQALVAQAESFRDDPSIQVYTTPQAAPAAGTDPQEEARKHLAAFQGFKEELMLLELPVGWSHKHTAGSLNPHFRAWPGWMPRDRQALNLWGSTIRFHFWGWILTALAASLGAPFWFDMLNKVISIRSAGKAPEEKPKKPKEVPTPVEPGQTPAEADVIRAAGARR